MGARGVESLTNHQAGLGIQMRWREALDPHRDPGVQVEEVELPHDRHRGHPAVPGPVVGRHPGQPGQVAQPQRAAPVAPVVALPVVATPAVAAEAAE